MGVTLCVGAAQALTLQPIVEGLGAPVAISHVGDGRMLVVEQQGRIRFVKEGRLLPRAFLDITDKVIAGDELGLLGLALHPQFLQNDKPGVGLFWVNYTSKQGRTVIARYRVNSKDSDVADPHSALTLLQIPQPYPNHNGGQLQFGPPEGPAGKRFLYIGMGDGGHGGDPHDFAQNDASLLGKLLRIDPSLASLLNPPFFSLPQDNPNATSGMPGGAIWAKGLRNPWRFSFDATTGELFIADVGQDQWEEINRTPAGRAALNYGWRIMEGAHCFRPKNNCERRGLVVPIHEYRNGGARCAVVGGYVYRGRRLPQLAGFYFYADYCSGEIFSLGRQGGVWKSEILLRAPFNPLTFGQDYDGELYVAGSNGVVYKIVP